MAAFCPLSLVFGRLSVAHVIYSLISDAVRILMHHTSNLAFDILFRTICLMLCRTLSPPVHWNESVRWENNCEPFPCTFTWGRKCWIRPKKLFELIQVDEMFIATRCGPRASIPSPNTIYSQGTDIRYSLFAIRYSYSLLFAHSFLVYSIRILVALTC